MNAPEWATHKARFCGIVPVWYADDGEGCTMQGRGWFADAILLPIVSALFSVAAYLSDWEVFPVVLTQEIAPRAKE